MTTLGIDLGTGSVKAALVDDDATVLAKASQTYGVTSLHPGWAEADPQHWLDATQDVVARVVAAAPGQRPTAVGFSGQMHGVVVVDADLRPMRPAILWADARSVPQARALAEALSPAELSRLGSPAVTGFSATTLAWLLEHEPDVMAQAAYALQPKDWLRSVLGGDVATDPSDASGTLLYDVVAGEWSSRALDWLGLSPSVLPDVCSSVAPVGALRLAGLRDEVACVVGAADTACALAGLGLGPGEGFVAVGSGAQVVRVMDKPQLDESLRTHTFASAGAPGAGWYRIGAMQSAGLSLTAALTWFDATVEEAAAAVADGMAADDPVFVPYLSGERTPFMDPTLRGSWHRLSMSTSRAAMLRSVLEGVTQAVALGVEAVQVAGEPLPELVPLVGGGTKDPAFQQLLADACNLRLAVTEAPDSAVVGAALLAAGLTVNPRRPARTSVVEPDAGAVALLQHRREMMVRQAASREGT